MDLGGERWGTKMPLCALVEDSHSQGQCGCHEGGELCLFYASRASWVRSWPGVYDSGEQLLLEFIYRNHQVPGKEKDAM